jgi:hypothetical protein
VDFLWTIAGVVLIVLTLRDIFDTLFHPLGRSHIGSWIVGGVSRLGHRLAARMPSAPVLIGPLGYIAVVVTWTALLAVGWALILLPHLPEGFLLGEGLDRLAHDDFADALYVSLVNLTSLGYGDITPEGPLLRILGPVETLFGLGLLTASISWLISIYSVISRRDSFAHEVHLSRDAEERLGEKLADADPELLERMLASFTAQMVVTRRDLIHFPITHHFRTEDEEHALSRLLPFLRRLVEEAGEASRPHALKLRAQMLGSAIDDFAETLRSRLQMPGETTEETLEHYDAHHRQAAEEASPQSSRS